LPYGTSRICRDVRDEIGIARKVGMAAHLARLDLPRAAASIPRQRVLAPVTPLVTNPIDDFKLFCEA
jgi:hypothetical protein